MTNKKTTRKSSPKSNTARKTSKTTRELSKAEKFYIQSKNDEMSLSELCDDLSLDKDVVESYYNECVTKRKNNFTVDKLMNVNKKKGYAIMSKEASEVADERKNKPKQTDTKHIYKIRPE